MIVSEAWSGGTLLGASSFPVSGAPLDAETKLRELAMVDAIVYVRSHWRSLVGSSDFVKRMEPRRGSILLTKFPIAKPPERTCRLARRCLRESGVVFNITLQCARGIPSALVL